MRKNRPENSKTLLGPGPGILMGWARGEAPECAFLGGAEINPSTDTEQNETDCGSYSADALEGLLLALTASSKDQGQS